MCFKTASKTLQDKFAFSSVNAVNEAGAFQVSCEALIWSLDTKSCSTSRRLRNKQNRKLLKTRKLVQ